MSTTQAPHLRSGMHTGLAEGDERHSVRCVQNEMKVPMSSTIAMEEGRGMWKTTVFNFVCSATLES